MAVLHAPFERFGREMTFWSLDVVHREGAPLLIISVAGNQAVVSWNPSVTGSTLQTNADLSTAT